MKKDDNLYKCVCVPPLDFSRENFGAFQGKGCNDDLSQARWNWLIMIFKYLFFVLDALPLLYQKIFKQKRFTVLGEGGWKLGVERNQTSRRL